MIPIIYTARFSAIAVGQSRSIEAGYWEKVTRATLPTHVLSNWAPYNSPPFQATDNAARLTAQEILAAKRGPRRTDDPAAKASMARRLTTSASCSCGGRTKSPLCIVASVRIREATALRL